MDQKKIGLFIKNCRKEKELTQQELDDKLGVSFKTISKWECGNGLPDVSLMIPLCDELGITVNDLLSAEHIHQYDYMEKAEENLLEVVNEKNKNKRILILTYLIALNVLIAGLTLMVFAAYLEMEEWIRIILIIIGFIVILSGVIICCFLDNGIGSFECKECNEKFVPSMKDYIMAPHIGTTRRLKCPKCGKTTYCKKRLTK